MATEQETWFLVISGGARAGSFDFGIGDAIFVQSDRVEIHAGPTGLVGLAAYTGGGLVPHLLQRVGQLGQPGAMDGGLPQALQVPTFFPLERKVASTNGSLDISQ